MIECIAVRLDSRMYGALHAWQKPKQRETHPPNITDQIEKRSLNVFVLQQNNKFCDEMLKFLNYWPTYDLIALKIKIKRRHSQKNSCVQILMKMTLYNNRKIIKMRIYVHLRSANLAWLNFA